MFSVYCVTAELRNLIMKREVRDSDIVRLNRNLPLDEVQIEKESAKSKFIKTNSFESTGRDYKYATFNFKKANKRVKVAFTNHKLEDSELLNLGIKTKGDIEHFSSPGPEGVWFVSPEMKRLNPAIPMQKGMPLYGTSPIDRSEPNPVLFTRNRYGEILLNIPAFERIVNGVHPSRILGSARYLSDLDGFISLLKCKNDIDIMLFNQFGAKEKSEIAAELVAELEKYGIVRIGENRESVIVRFPGSEENVVLHITDQWNLNAIMYDIVRYQGDCLSMLQKMKEGGIGPSQPDKTVKIYLSISYYFGDPELYVRRLREFLCCKNEHDFTELKDNILRQDLDVLSERMRGLSNEEMLERVRGRLNVKEPVTGGGPEGAALSAQAAKAETSMIHAENLNYTPTIPNKTILCHIITDSILPAGQRNMLKTLEQEMRNEKYSEKVVSLSAKDSSNPKEFMDELGRIKAREEAKYPGYKIQFDVACSSK
jgi:hypothetical protein